MFRGGSALDGQARVRDARRGSGCWRGLLAWAAGVGGGLCAVDQRMVPGEYAAATGWRFTSSSTRATTAST